MQTPITIQALRLSIAGWNNKLKESLEQETLKKATESLLEKVQGNSLGSLTSNNNESETRLSTQNVDNVNQQSSKREYKGNQYELDMFKQKIQYIEYKKHNAKNKKVNPNANKVNTVFANTDELEKELDKTAYKKPWARLDMYSKKKKIKEYLESQIQLGELKGTIDIYYPKMEQMIHEKKLTKKSEVDYDQETCTITRIHGFTTIFPNA